MNDLTVKMLQDAQFIVSMVDCINDLGHFLLAKEMEVAKALTVEEKLGKRELMLRSRALRIIRNIIIKRMTDAGPAKRTAKSVAELFNISIGSVSMIRQNYAKHLRMLDKAHLVYCCVVPVKKKVVPVIPYSYKTESFTQTCTKLTHYANCIATL